MKKIQINVMPMDKKLEARQGSSLLAALLQARVPIMNRCGGKGSCGTCKVQVTETAAASPLTRNEQRLLGEGEIRSGLRLSCQYKIEKPVVVTLPETPLQRTVRKMMEENRRKQD